MTKPIDEAELDKLKQSIYLYGDICAQHQSMCHFGKYDVQQRNLAIRESAKDLLADIEAHTAQAVTAALKRVDEALPEKKVQKGDMCPYCYEDKESGLTPFNDGHSKGIDQAHQAIANELSKWEEAE